MNFGQGPDQDPDSSGCWPEIILWRGERDTLDLLVQVEPRMIPQAVAEQAR